MRDINLEDTIHALFTTKAFSTGVPTTLAGTPVLSIYEENNLTQITAGVSVTVDYDSVTGLNQATIVATAANGYEAGKSYDLVITTGTVDGVSVVGEVVYSFTIEAGAIGLNATARTALEDQYDGTGLTGDTYPSTQAQVGNLATGSSAISKRVTLGTVNVGIVIGGTTYTNTYTIDGIFHSITEDGSGNFDVQYDFDVGGNGIGSEIVMDGYFSGNGDVLQVQAYNWVGATWEDIGTVVASSGTDIGESRFVLDVQHTGTGANIGEVQVRGYEAGGGLSSVQLNMDRVRIDYSIVAQSVGYALGRVWCDTAEGTAGTEVYVNGVADNPSLTIAEMLTIAGNLNIHDLHMTSDSTFAPTTDIQGYNIFGVGYTCDLGGHDYAGTHIFHASPLTGIATTTGGSDHLDIVGSIVGNVTVDDTHFTSCSFNGTITLDQVTSGDLKIIDSRSIIAGSGTPIIDCGTAAVTHSISIAHWQNGLEVRNLNNGGTNLFSISGTGQLIVASTCSGTMNIRGQWKITDNSGGSVTFVYDDVHQDVIDTLADTNELQADWADGGRLDLIQDDILVDTATTIPAKIDTLGIKKNTAFSNYEFLMVLTSDHVTPAIGLAVTGQKSINGAAFASVAGTITEVSNGIYQFDALAADTNGDLITWRFSSATADDAFETFTTIA